MIRKILAFRALSAFQYPRFRRIWAAAVLVGLGNWIERLSVGWFVLEQTDSVLLTALSFALRNAPNLVFGPVSGAVADSLPRVRLLMLTLACKVLLLTTMALLLIAGIHSVWVILMLVFLMGTAFTVEVPTTQALITDSVPRDDAMNGIALYSVGTRAIGVAGAIAGGVLIEQSGVGAAFFTAAVMVGIGMSIVVGMPSQQATVLLPLRSVFATAVTGLQSMVRLPLVRTLLLLTIAMEILAYSYQSLLPSMARDVLNVGPTGLGTLSFGAGIGSLLGSVTLSLLGNFRHKGLLLLFVTIGYGACLVLFSQSTLFPISTAIIVGVGAMAALFDALQWITLQQYVPNDMRGRVIGGWVFATGFGWVGHIVLGGVAELLGVQSVLAISGSIVAVLGLILLAFFASLRQA